jgi:hypothetical protein
MIGLSFRTNDSWRGQEGHTPASLRARQGVGTLDGRHTEGGVIMNSAFPTPTSAAKEAGNFALSRSR